MDNRVDIYLVRHKDDTDDTTNMKLGGKKALDMSL